MVYHKTRNSGLCGLGKSGIAQLNTTRCFSEGFVVMHVDSTYVSRNVAKARISCCNLHWQPCTVPSGVWTGSLYLVPSDKKYAWRKISELKNLHWSCSYREHSSPSDYNLFQRWSRILSPRCYRSSRSGNNWDTMADNTGHRLQPTCDGKTLIP